MENRPLTSSTTSGSESYAYDADGKRVKVVAGSTTTVYLGGLWEETSAGATKAYYSFGGQTVAVRDSTNATDPVSYLHGDHLGSVSAASGASASSKGSQRFDPWGKRIAGAVTQKRPLAHSRRWLKPAPGSAKPAGDPLGAGLEQHASSVPHSAHHKASTTTFCTRPHRIGVRGKAPVAGVLGAATGP